MSAALLPVWNEIEYYLDNGISVIPVRDKDDAFGVAKSPFGPSWKQYQKEIISKDLLFNLMDERYNTTAIGIVAGAVSGNLEVIDIDVKYKYGCDVDLFNSLKTLYPHLFEKLRIHKSPSGGYHILYRCEEPVPGNQKLAGRPATEDELLKKPKTKTYNFIETRGEGGYVLAPPSLGYQVVKSDPIPILSKAERESIIGLCKSFSELIQIEKPAKTTKTEIQYYETNPFEDYNTRAEPTELMEGMGWSYSKSNNQFIWYTRPGKSKGISLSFNLNKRFFYCFTSSTELDENKGYTPSNLLCALKFNGDKKKLYAFLVENGFGIIKHKFEKDIVKKAAINGSKLPKNISLEAKNLHKEISDKLVIEHPYGVYWIDSSQHGIQIDRELFYHVADSLGFKLYKETLIISDGTYIEECSNRFFFDKMKQYIHEEEADLYRDICNAFEAFIEKHGSFTITRLQVIPEDFILKDNKDTAYKCYENGILQITADRIEIITDVDKLIWKKTVKNRKYIPGEGGKFVEFLNLSTDVLTNSQYIFTCIGYLAHEFKDETSGYIIVLTEQCENPKDGGGAGKNVFSELFKHITTFAGRPGGQVKFDEKFMQSWNGEKIFCISDVPKHFNFSFLKELSTGTAIMKKLFKNEVEIPNVEMPKFLIQTNYSYEISDGGLKRRIKQIEFTDYFSKCGGVDVHFNAHFPKDWNDEDWAGFDNIMVSSIQLFLRNNRKIGLSEMSGGGWVKQFEQTWGAVVSNFIKQYFHSWIESKWVSNETFKAQLEDYYKENNTPLHFRPSMIKINNAIKAYCEWKKIQYHFDMLKKVNMVAVKYRWFDSEENTPY